MIEFFLLAILGLLTGFLSGFFGIGGGTFLVPALMLVGFGIKEAIAISVMQMAFSSVVGSYINLAKNSLELKNALYLGVGGFAGALFSGYIVSVVSSLTLKYMFVAVVIFAIAKFFFANEEGNRVKGAHSEGFLFRVGLLGLGFVVGAFSISLGVGGAILIGPIMAGVFRYGIKDAVMYSLFFVVFSSIAGVVSMAYHGHLDVEHGIVVALSSVLGVYMGVKALVVVDVSRLKSSLVVLYLVILAIMLKEIILG